MSFFGGQGNKFLTARLAGMANTASINASALATQTSLGGVGALAGGGVGGGLGMGEDATADTAAGGGFGLSDLFGGFMASGGDVSPGKAYIVGEKRPELFIPKTSGQIVPSTQTASGKQQARNTTINNTFNFSEKTDLFKKSPSQVNAEQSRQLSIANSRN
jgi:hypothetical protein